VNTFLHYVYYVLEVMMHTLRLNQFVILPSQTNTDFYMNVIDTCNNVGYF